MQNLSSDKLIKVEMKFMDQRLWRSQWETTIIYKESEYESYEGVTSHLSTLKVNKCSWRPRNKFLQFVIVLWMKSEIEITQIQLFLFSVNKPSTETEVFVDTEVLTDEFPWQWLH